MGSARSWIVALAVTVVSCSPPPVPASIGYFRANPLTIKPGQSAELKWEANGVASCTLDPSGETVAPKSSTLVSPTATTTYELRCGAARASAVVEVRPDPVIERFEINPTHVAPDSVATLSWKAANSTGCTVTPSSKFVSGEGTLEVRPGASTIYTLTCEGNGPNAVATAEVTVTPLTSLDAPTEVTVVAGDGVLTVSWKQTQGIGKIYFAAEAGITTANIDTLRERVIFRRATSPFVISALQNGQAYFLRVAASSGALESDLTTEVSSAPVEVVRDDPYFSEQWHLDNVDHQDIDVLPVWSAGGRGEGVKVAIVDEGVDLAHEDLLQNVSTQQSYDYLGNAPVYAAEHGTCVAGLVAARDHNGVGVRGVAPRAQLRSFNLLQDFTSLNERDSMTRGKDVVSVSNNSWGDAADGTGLLTRPDSLWLRGVTEGATTGRGGKGVVYFWAAGNGANDADDSNFDSQANSRFVIAVGGVGRNGWRAYYAEGGSNVLVVAPTEGDDGIALTTTDITGRDGYNSGNGAEHRDPNYSKTFNGTSGATPIAAGVGVLVLQARPELSYRDVRRVLAQSARKCEPQSPGWQTNGAGLHVHHGYGFGVVDARAAVALARTISLVGPELTASVSSTSAPMALPDGDGQGITSTLQIANSGIGHVEVIEVEVNVGHTNSGEVEVALTRPGGIRDVLHPVHQCRDARTQSRQCAEIDDYVFTTMHHLDEPADGPWTLEVRDTKAGTVGVFNRWSMRVYGAN